MILDEIAEDSSSYHRLYSASDVVTAFGAQNVIAISSTDVKLINNILLKDGASGFPAIFQRGGNVTIQSDRYMSDFYAFSGQGGRLNISGGDFCGTGVSEYSNSFGIELKDGIDATISGGYFHGEGADLFARKDVSEENPLRLVISGGLFTSKQTGNYNAGIVITWTGSAVAPNLPGMIATNSVLSPATEYTGKSSTWYYA